MIALVQTSRLLQYTVEFRADGHVGIRTVSYIDGEGAVTSVDIPAWMCARIGVEARTHEIACSHCLREAAHPYDLDLMRASASALREFLASHAWHNLASSIAPAAPAEEASEDEALP